MGVPRRPSARRRRRPCIGSASAASVVAFTVAAAFLVVLPRVTIAGSKHQTKNPPQNITLQFTKP